MKTFLTNVAIAFELIVLALTVMSMTLVSKPSQLINCAKRFVTKIDDIIDMIDAFLAPDYSSIDETFKASQSLINTTYILIW